MMMMIKKRRRKKKNIINIDDNDMFWLNEKKYPNHKIENWNKINSLFKGYYKSFEDYKNYVNSHNKKINTIKNKYSDIRGEYLKLMDNDNFCEELAKLCILNRNMHSFTGMFTPYVCYLTPQCGEYKAHQMILEKFVEINKKHCID